MNSELKKPNSFKLLLEEHEDDFFRIPEMTQQVRFFATRAQSKAQIMEDKITRSLRTYQSTGNMVDAFFSGMVGTVIGMTGGSTPLRGRRHLPPDGGSF
ncbi:MAG: hypothetical protein RIS64_517 [Bacteroidota bacterium]|jgi:murein L,D-transpeptidase YafK